MDEDLPEEYLLENFNQFLLVVGVEEDVTGELKGMNL
jgi:hypothetical protein